MDYNIFRCPEEFNLETKPISCQERAMKKAKKINPQ